ncbi:MAG: hypothetical protein RJB65_683 [Actinomycetota bacterium]
MSNPAHEPFDVAVVGAGVVGCAVARHLTLAGLRCALLEARADVGSGTSKANTAILHTGFDATPGSVEARLVARGYQLLSAWAPLAGVSVEETDAVLVAWDDEQASTLPRLAEKSRSNGHHDVEILDASSVRDAEPHLGPGLAGGMLVRGEHIIDPWSTPIGFAREAVTAGCALLTRFEVAEVAIDSDTTTLRSTDGRGVRARYVVNAAGLHGDTLHRMMGFAGFTIRPRRGELIVFDKFARGLLSRTILPVPTSHTKGVLVAPTVFGNVMLGPTADDIDDRTATGTTVDGLASLLERGRRILPRLLDEEVTATYAGLRTATEHSDYQLSADAGSRYVCLGGIRSTGLTASMALGEECAAMLAGIGLQMPMTLGAPTAVAPAARMSPLGDVSRRPWQDGDRIVCHCERATAEEIVAAVTGPVPAHDLDGVRRRTRAMNGRCQGFGCTAGVCATAATATGTEPAAWLHAPEAGSR